MFSFKLLWWTCLKCWITLVTDGWMGQGSWCFGATAVICGPQDNTCSGFPCFFLKWDIVGVSPCCCLRAVDTWAGLAYGDPLLKQVRKVPACWLGSGVLLYYAPAQTAISHSLSPAAAADLKYLWEHWWGQFLNTPLLPFPASIAQQLPCPVPCCRQQFRK